MMPTTTIKKPSKEAFSRKDELLEVAVKLVNQEMSLDEYLNKYSIPLASVVYFVDRVDSFTPEQKNYLHNLYIRSLNYAGTFDEEKYLREMSIIVDGKLVKPTSEQVHACINFIRKTGIYECDYTIRMLVAFYVQNKVQLDLEQAEQEVANFQTQLEEVEQKKSKRLFRERKTEAEAKWRKLSM